MGYLDRLVTMIAGETISLRPSFPSSGTPQIEIGGYDLSYQFTRTRTRKPWKDRRDSQVVRDIVTSDEVKHKLRNLNIDKTEPVLPKIVNNKETDYDFIKTLANRNCFEFYVRERGLYFCKPKEDDRPIALEYGKSLQSFTPELDIANQVSELKVKGWGPRTKQEMSIRRQPPLICGR